MPAEAPRFGKYSLVAKLATGGMAEIFLARLQGAAGFEKLVCIKRILPQYARDKQFVSMFLAEAKIAAQIAHANVCQVFELGEIDGRYFIAMEYLEGVPLACFRRLDLYPHPTDARLVAGLGVQGCEGLHHAHQLKRGDGTPLEVVHRDVSGNNLFGTVDGTVKVLDFGIAKVQDSATRTSTGSVKGTYAYMAPEQLRGERVDRRADVFAMGIVVWELLAQRHLFRRDTEYLTFEAITTLPIPDICELRPEVPRALGAAVARALARDRDARYPTARAFGEALGQSVASLGGPMPPSAIGDEIVRAFGARLTQQHELIQLARAGGALPLDEDIGPQVGHGTELLTTPVSIVSGLTGATTSSTSNPSGPLSARVSLLAASPPVAPVSPRPITSTAPPVELPRSRVSLWVALTIIIAAATAAIAVSVVKSGRKSPAPPPVIAVAPPVVPPTTAPATPTTPTTAPDPTTTAAPTAPPATAPATDPDPASAPTDPAIATAPAPTPTVTPVRPPKPTPPDKPRPATTHKAEPKPTGPPGFITIDSAPVYAVIFIDGKRYGETPLVRQSLAPGKHNVRAVSPSGATRNLTIKIDSGKVSPPRRIEW